MNPTTSPPIAPKSVCVPSLVMRLTSAEAPTAPTIAAKPFTPRKNSALVVSMAARFSRRLSERIVFVG